MQHHRKNRKFGRVRNQRKALLRNLAFSFFLSGRIITTEAKAKELRPFVEKIISDAKYDSVSTRRALAKKLPEKIIPKIVKDIAPRFQTRSGGYTRIIRLGERRSDSAKEAILELV